MKVVFVFALLGIVSAFQWNETSELSPSPESASNSSIWVDFILDIVPITKASESEDNQLEEWTLWALIMLKKSGIVSDTIKNSLTDDEVRHLVAELTIEILKADVIPYEEVFRALKESGLAQSIVDETLTDKATRRGLVKLIVELTPQLVELGIISGADLTKSLAKGLPGKLANVKDLKSWLSSLCADD